MQHNIPYIVIKAENTLEMVKPDSKHPAIVSHASDQDALNSITRWTSPHPTGPRKRASSPLTCAAGEFLVCLGQQIGDLKNTSPILSPRSVGVCVLFSPQ